MGFRNPVTSVSAATVASSLDTRATPASVGVVLDNHSVDVEGGAGAGVVWLGSGPAAGLLDSVRSVNFPGIGRFVIARWLRLVGGSSDAYTGTSPTITLTTTDTTAPNKTGQTTPVNRSGVSIVADDISLRGAVTGGDSVWSVVGDTANGAPPYANAWTSYTVGGYGGAKFRKLISGDVEVTGLIFGGTISTTLPAFTLPPGYRPGNRKLFTSNGNNALARLDVDPAGGVFVAIGSSAAFTSLDPIRFFAEA